MNIFLPETEMLIEDTEAYARTLHLVDCPKCRGTGSDIVDYQPNVPVPPCPSCDGKGKVLMRESEFKVWEGK